MSVELPAVSPLSGAVPAVGRMLVPAAPGDVPPLVEPVLPVLLLPDAPAVRPPLPSLQAAARATSARVPAQIEDVRLLRCFDIQT